MDNIEDRVERDNYVAGENVYIKGRGEENTDPLNPPSRLGSGTGVLSHPPTDLEVLMQRARVDTNLRLDLMKKKNQDYASANDVLENFRRNADDLGISIPTAILAMASKHWRALCKWSQNKELETTNFDEIAGDIHNFLDLLKHWKETHKHV